MPDSRILIGVLVYALTTISSTNSSLADIEIAEAEAAKFPRIVVERWLELHRTGQRDQAEDLTTGSHHHRGRYLIPSKRDTGVRVVQSLSNKNAAAVVAGPLKDVGDRERVLLFWLVRRNGLWLINKSDSVDRRAADDRLIGFREAGNARWHVRNRDLLGQWEAGPGVPPGASGTTCGSQLRLSDDNHYRLTYWGPAGPDPENDDVIQGVWRSDGDRIILSDQDRTLECRIVWMTGRRLVIASKDGKGLAEYRRTDAQANDDQEGNELE